MRKYLAVMMIALASLLIGGVAVTSASAAVKKKPVKCHVINKKGKKVWTTKCPTKPGKAGKNGVGTAGAQGAPGVNGTNGAKGADGTNGVNGAKGDTGTAGKDGVNGKDGAAADQGIQGEKGDRGMSAYEVWIADGNFGKTMEDFLFAIKGAKGDNGKDGVNGHNGSNGVDGKDGAPGLDGKDGSNGLPGVGGKSAYELFLALNPTSTLSLGQWMQSLKG